MRSQQGRATDWTKDGCELELTSSGGGIFGCGLRFRGFLEARTGTLDSPAIVKSTQQRD